jgi:hypothetical protein
MVYTFNIKNLEKLYQHSKNSKKHYPLYAQGQEDTPGFWLVSDGGVYMMSNGAPRLLAGDPQRPERNEVVYALGGRPEEVGYTGGDDFAEFIPIEWYEYARDLGNKHLHVLVTAKQVKMLTE